LKESFSIYVVVVETVAVASAVVEAFVDVATVESNVNFIETQNVNCTFNSNKIFPIKLV
jgi:hypothetical protein